MNGKEFISEERAASLAGVSPKTLARFAEAGYLQVENDTAGAQRYLVSEIKELFGVMDQDFYDKLAQDLSQGVDSTPVGAVSPPADLGYRAEVLDTPQSLVWEDEPAHGRHAEIREMPAGEAAQPDRSNELLKAELVRLRNLMQIQERILDIRDEQLRKLEEENRWFKTRIEKLEQKAERDQLLLLSESQTVRRLVMLHESRRSPFRAALEWLGLVPTAQLPAPERPAIESTETGASR